MLNIKLKVNGRDVPLNPLGTMLRDAMDKETEHAVQASIQNLRFRMHGRSAKVTVTGASARPRRYRVTACCDELRAAVEKLLK
jgi:hypothetical protein